ncbi:hypothetical protein ABZ806_44915, partial [Spirillospora sp. NPDC047418]
SDAPAIASVPVEAGAVAARGRAAAGVADDADADDAEVPGEPRQDVRNTVTVRKVVQSGPRQQPRRGTRQQRRGGGK